MAGVRDPDNVAAVMYLVMTRTLDMNIMYWTGNENGWQFQPCPGYPPSDVSYEAFIAPRAWEPCLVS